MIIYEDANPVPVTDERIMLNGRHIGDVSRDQNGRFFAKLRFNELGLDGAMLPVAYGHGATKSEAIKNAIVSTQRNLAKFSHAVDSLSVELKATDAHVFSEQQQELMEGVKP